ncbi:ATP-binding protein [Thorsellia anophelis]|uniref:DNA replication protein DnaC n=1 Tax=Thorsellia anophelis DSM 18579 TaxID=1123402 RepID=A0A1I0CBL3_9GAMM|nr:ATP-binding protein [Thorsellia anophelis]SET16916.1 DNA replication protein DnaC [Thorsellia anophelis DSM 18579]
MQCLSELQRIMPTHIKPKFRTVEELIAFHDAEALKQSHLINERNRQARIQRILGRSGIQKLHSRCGFRNYQASTREQKDALAKALDFYKGFNDSKGGFVFSGNVGTGKNHLATAIARGLIQQGKSVVIVTIAELAMRFRSCYEKDSLIKESELLEDLVGLDLLILDEIGVQKQANNDFEINLLNQLIDRRQLNLKPTGMLTNLNYQEMVKLLGNRIMDRQTCAGLWVSFTWQSYRSKKKSLAE